MMNNKMMNKIKVFVISMMCVTMLIGCFSKPEGVSQDFYDQITPLYTMINESMNSGDNLTQDDKQKIMMFKKKFKDMTEKEEDMMTDLMHVLKLNLEVELSKLEENPDKRNNALEEYVEVYKKIEENL